MTKRRSFSDKFRATSALEALSGDGDRELAAQYLGQLKKGHDAGLRTFDEETARTTQKLLEKHEAK
ncbi:MAG: hypothetical protein ACI84R_003011 [Candidatus Azotimanducaceae bacterium]|jgi:hypothetical protein